MTEVDFYVLPADSEQERLLFACRLAEKAFRLRRQVYIHTDTAAVSEQLDALLWSYKSDSFIAHNLLGEEGATSAPVAIGHQEDAGQHRDVLINLSAGVPRFFSRFNRVAEIVVQQPQVLASTRGNYSFYKERGYPLRNHDLRAKG